MNKTVFELIADNTMDSRDLIKRKEYLDSLDENELDDSIREELQYIADFQEAAGSEWQYGAIFIAWDYFEDYVKEILEDCGDIPKNLPDYIIIDWSATANNIARNYDYVHDFYVRKC